MRGFKILYLSPYFWPEEIGSAPYCTELAKHLAAQGHDVSTVAFRPHYPSVVPFADWATGQRDTEVSDGVNISRVAVRARATSGFKDRIRNDLRYLAHVVRSAIAGRFKGTDVVVAYVPSVLSLYGAKLASLRTGAKIIAIVHDIESGLASSLGIASNGLVLKILQRVERIGFNFADKVVVLTEGMKTEVENIGCRRPIEVISIWGEVGPDVPIDPSARPSVMYSGNFGKKQNIDQLLPFFELLTKNKIDVDIVMRGGGSERDRIEAEVVKREIANTKFLPLVPSAEFMASLQAVNIHLVPQALNVANYALPSKLFTIMSAGRPFVCVAAKDSPLDRLAEQSQAGLCIPPGDPTQLYEAVSDLLADPDKQVTMGRNGQNFIAEHMSRDSILDRYTTLVTQAAISKT